MQSNSNFGQTDRMEKNIVNPHYFLEITLLEWIYRCVKSQRLLNSRVTMKTNFNPISFRQIQFIQSFHRIFHLSNIPVVLVVAGLSLANWELDAKRIAPTAVLSQARNVYSREKLSNGEWKPETIAFAKGKMIEPGVPDDSLTRLSFREISATIADALAKVNYVATPSAEETDLLIVINWGKTSKFSDDSTRINMNLTGSNSQLLGNAQNSNSMGSIMEKNMSAGQDGGMGITAENEMAQMIMLQHMNDEDRKDANRFNAELLGYAPSFIWLESVSGHAGPYTTMKEDLMKEIESPRYFVILQAYDFQKLWKHKERDLLWVSRFSINAHNRRFDEELMDMAASSSSYFGTHSDRLIRKVPESHVTFGDIEVIGVEK